jgi:hypothetical protein
MNKQLLIETHPIKISSTPLTENVGGVKKSLIVEGILATAEVKNGNGRYYARDLWDREMKKYSELIKQRRAMGELDHPESQVINLKNVSHIISDYWWDGDNVMGKIEILNTPSGQNLEALIRNNVTVGVSSRGMGSLEQNGNVMEVQDDYELLCWDFVSTPSNPDSFMYPLKENLNERMESRHNPNYSKVNSIIYEILCSKGSCPIF